MQILKAYKTELNPNNKQKSFFCQCCGISRFVYNWALTDRIELYKQEKKTSCYSQRTRFNAIKGKQFPWIYNVPYAITEAAFANLDTAYQNFFRRVKQGTEKAGFPHFKHKGKNESFQLRGVKIFSDCVYVPRLGNVRLKENNYIPINVEKYGIYSTVSLKANRWFISILVYENIEQLQVFNNAVGVDFGIKDIATCSNGKVFENPKTLYQAERKLKRLQRELSRRKKGGQNWYKTKVKLRRAHYKIACIRNHIQHEISSYLVYDLQPDVIVLEDLNISGMIKNRHLAKAISDVGLFELRCQIEYKAKWAGIQIVLADRWFPSSKTCSKCGCVKSDLTLADRTFICNDCGLTINRDLNAAYNLRNLAYVVQ